MARETYQAELDALRNGVCNLGDDVVAMLDDGIDALDRGDERLARAVIERDRAIDERYLELEGDCVDLLALQQPVAGDLRFVASSFKVLTDLERVADLATNLGEYALAGERPAFPGVETVRIGEDASALVEASLAAYADGDTAACREIAARDDDLDALCQRASERVVRQLVEGDGDDPWEVEAVLDDVSRVLLTVRDLERVGDHAVNVAARTLYAAENDPELLY